MGIQGHYVTEEETPSGASRWPIDAIRPSGISRKYGIALTLLVILGIFGSLAIRGINLNSPLQEAHGFRQTQTAITVWYYLHEGISLLHPKTPVFGPPWEVPFEFPLYQWCAAQVIRWTHLPVDLGCRITHLLFFYLSAFALWSICRLVFSRGAALSILLVYLWLPFTILWSRTGMIEYAAVFLVLWQCYCLLRWWKAPTRWGWAVGAILAGSLGMMVKITTVAIAIPAMAIFAVYLLLEIYHNRKTASARRQVGMLIGITAMLAVMVGCGLAWTTHADHIKDASPVTAWLASHTDHMRAWNFGPLRQRLDPAAWKQLLIHVSCVLPLGFLLLPLVPLTRFRRYDALQRRVLLSVLLGALLPILVFFNLYVRHDYYFCAIAPCAALLAGLGLYELACIVRRLAMPARWSWTLIIVVLLAGSYGVLWQRYIPRIYAVSYRNSEYCVLGAYLRSISRPDEWLIVSGMEYGWDPSLLYYAQRKGMMLIDNVTVSPDALHDGQYQYMISYGKSPDVLKTFPKRTLVKQHDHYAIYRLGKQ